MSYQSGYDLDACIIKCEKYKAQRDKLLEYARHKDDCCAHFSMPYKCDCSLAELIKEIENDN